MIQIFTDGASRGNPGPGGYGVVLKSGPHYKELSEGFSLTTNNRMELMAVIAALEALNKPCDIKLYSDSKYVTDAFNQHWIESWLKKNWKNSANKPVKNIDLWKRLLEAAKIHKITFIWVKGHNGHPENERCDVLATTAADGNDLPEDSGMTE